MKTLSKLRKEGGKWLNNILDLFEDEYREVSELKVDTDYDFKFPPYK